MKDIRIAAIACRAPVGHIEENLQRVVQWVRQARSAGADLVCFPEMNISGYANSTAMASAAQPVPGPSTRVVSNLARETGMIILAGTAEENPHGKPFASHCVFWPDGRLDTYRKLHLAPPEQAYYTPGDQVPVFQADHFKFGILLCYDAHFPEISSAMAAQGAEILFMPHASPRSSAAEKHQSWLRHLPARAFDNGVFVVACNQWGANANGLDFPGNSLVIGPSGMVLAKNDSGDGEHMLVADLTADALAAVRNHPMRYFFPNRRPQLYAACLGNLPACHEPPK